MSLTRPAPETSALPTLSKKMPAAPPPDGAPPGPTEPKLSVSFFGFKVDGSGATGVRLAFWIALAFQVSTRWRTCASDA
jgi:hypothetical protein